MSNFKIEFTLSPYILLLIIPAAAITILIYFLVKKRFRRINKRAISLVLHIVILALCITALSGIKFTWSNDDVEDELVILVDCTDSSKSSRERVDGFVKEVIEESRAVNFAVVKFGYDQVLAVDMGKHGASSAYNAYMGADEPDTTGTDIRSALAYVYDPLTGKSGGESGKAIISDPASTRILLIGDGLETDRNAASIAKLMALDGVRIDTCFFPANYSQDVWIVNATYPDKSLDLGEKFEHEVTLYSSYEGTFDLNFSDNGELQYKKTELPLKAGSQTVKIPHSFDSSGHHELKFGITAAGDTTIENNVYYTGYDVELYNKILILESYEGESKTLVNIMKGRPDAEYLTINVLNIKQAPKTIEELELYDQVILVNIARSDIPNGFEDILYTYVHDRNGGLLTIGGFELTENGDVKTTTDGEGNEKPIAHAYNEEDLSGTTYQELLPVKIEDYLPPTALAIIIDRSASMEINNEAPFERALEGAVAAVNSLSTRDFVAVMSMSNSYHVALDFTPMSQKSKIMDAIYRIADEPGGSTGIAASLEHACRGLSTIRSVEKKHILLLTDGMPGDPGVEYQPIIEKYNKEFNITLTVVSVQNPINEELETLAALGNGGAYLMISDVKELLPEYLRTDLGFEKEYEGAVKTQYNPTLKSHTPVVDGITQTQLDKIDMDGFFVSRVKNSTVQVPLMAKYVPMYAQWEFGNGKVGSLMTDLMGYFSSELIANEETGMQIINNIISTLMPIKKVRTGSLNVHIIEDNYRTQVSVMGYDKDAESDKKLIAFVKSPSGKMTKFDLSDGSFGGNRFTFENREPGSHTITVLKVPASYNIANAKDADDVADRYIMGYSEAYRTFSYSEEYNAALDSFTQGKELLVALSSRTDVEGEDKLITSADDLVNSLTSLNKSFDPRYILIGIAFVLFLIEIALRKFKLPQIKKILQKIGLIKNNKQDNVQT